MEFDEDANQVLFWPGPLTRAYGAWINSLTMFSLAKLFVNLQ